MMFNTLSIVIIINQVLSFKKIRSHYRNTKKSFQMCLNENDDYSIEVLKARFLLGMVDSLSSELIKSINVELLSNNHDFDDIISTLPHQLTKELINDKSKITDEIPPKVFNTGIIMENISYSLILVPTSSIVDTSNQSISPTLLANGIYKSTATINQISVKSTSSTSDIAQNASNDNIIPKSIDAIVKNVLRYCVPPMVMQTVPHKLPQIILQWIHEHMT